MTDKINQIDNDAMYVATIKLYSRGNNEQVATSIEVSHELDDGFNDELPASYSVAREIIMMLHSGATSYAATDEDRAFLQNPEVADEDKISRILDSTAAQEEVAKATIN